MVPMRINPDALLESLEWRYATKLFDPAQKIPPMQWDALEEALILSPSSYGLQPWKFLVITDQVLRQKLLPHSWNQKQVTDCSHFVVFLGKLDVTQGDVERWVGRIAQTRGVPAGSLKAYRDMMLGDLVSGPRHAVIREWAARQVYIALGNFMTSAAMLGIDTCPMEGIDPAQYDTCLELKGSGWSTLVACAAGYRSASDKYAALKKVRYAREEIIQHR